MLPALTAAGPIAELLQGAWPILKPLLLWTGLSKGMDLGGRAMEGFFPGMNPEYRMLERQIGATKELEARKSAALKEMAKQDTSMMLMQRALNSADAAEAAKLQMKLGQGQLAATTAAHIGGTSAFLNKKVTLNDVLGLG